MINDLCSLTKLLKDILVLALIVTPNFMEVQCEVAGVPLNQQMPLLDSVSCSLLMEQCTYLSNVSRLC